MEIKTNITKQDWIEFHLFHQLRRRRALGRHLAWAFVPPLAIIGLLFAVIAHNTSGPIRYSNTLPLALILPLYLALFYGVTRRQLAREITASLESHTDRFFLGERVVALSPEGIAVTTESESTFRRWEEIPQVLANADYGYIYSGTDQALIIPQRCFQENGYFRAFIKSAVFHHWEKEIAPTAESAEHRQFPTGASIQIAPTTPA